MSIRNKEIIVENPDEGLVGVTQSDLYAQVYELFDEIEDSLTDRDAAIITEILSLVEENYERDSRQWDKLLNRLVILLNQLNEQQSEAGDWLEDGYADEEEEEADNTRSLYSQLSSILEDAQTL